jgi:RNA polymerase sigma-54 factor
MSTFLGYDLTQNQQIGLTPKMIEELKVLQMSNTDLLQYINEQLIENPLLEMEDADSGILDSIEDIGENDYDEIDKNIEKREFTEYTSSPVTLREYLISQIGELKIPLSYRRTALYLIENVDEDGYISLDIKNIVLKLNFSVKIVKGALKIIQGLEPAGVGARNLNECILIQLNRKGILTESIKDIVVNYLQLLADRKYNEISQKTGLSTEQVAEAHGMIKKLNPKPGQVFKVNNGNQYISPELTIKELDGKYTVMFMNESFSNLGVCEHYKKYVNSNNSSKEVSKFVRAKLSKAIEVINAVEQRKRTILSVAGYIIEYQMEFLKKGHMYLKPLTMKMIADMVGLHESTVSRTVNEKYIETPRGTFELKFFFSSTIDSNSCTNIAANAVKRIIKEIVQNEDKKKPLSDEQIKKLLEEDGVRVARRTIAKYREELHILPSNLRSVKV